MTEDAHALWTASELATAVHGALTAPIGLPITGISIDTRTIKPGDLFVALRGHAGDGHDHVAAALAAGAAAAMIAHEPDGIGPGAPLLRVDDTLLALERLGDVARRRSEACFIAVTGSVGKTGTKEMLAAILAEQGPTHASPASYNNHWGVPLTLARLPRHACYAVLELGMNHAGEIAQLTRQVRPQIAIVTTVEPAHLEFFESIEAIADAKAEIFLGMAGTGTAILNADNAMFGRLKDAATDRGLHHIIGFGSSDDADPRLVSYVADAGGTSIVMRHAGRELKYRLKQHGRHIAINSLAVLAAVAAAGADLERAAATLATVEPLAGRGRRVDIAVVGGTALLIDESYNASPAAMQAALATLAASEPADGGRRLAVLGDMRELGPTGPELHRSLIADLARSGVAHLFCCGKLMRHLADAGRAQGVLVTHADTAAALALDVSAALRAGDIVLVKGSLGSRMADIVRPLMARATSATDGEC